MENFINLIIIIDLIINLFFHLIAIRNYMFSNCNNEVLESVVSVLDRLDIIASAITDGAYQNKKHNGVVEGVEYNVEGVEGVEVKVKTVFESEEVKD